MTFDAIVVGLGALGSAAARALAAAGARVLGLEQFRLGHHRGASHDHARIIRRSYHTPGYVRLAGLADRAWEDLERETGERLLVRTGGLDLFPPGAAIPPGPYLASLDACGVPYRWLDAAEVRRRWPVSAWSPAPAGSGRPTAAWSRPPGGPSCSSAWPSTMAPASATRPRWPGSATSATPWRRGPPTARSAPRGCCCAPTPGPTSCSPRSARGFYGFPVWPGTALKAAQDVGGREVTARSRRFDPDPAASQRLAGFLRARLPAALGAHASTTTCLYTLPPDRDFVLGRLPGHDRVLVALGAAHAFKFAPLLGRLLADLALHGGTQEDLSPFDPGRAALTAPVSEPRYLV